MHTPDTFSPVLAPAVDVLVLGAGLAGLRAAWAARQARPGALVLVAAPLAGPSGSSFANANGRLGLHAPMGDREREAFCREVAAVSGPGVVSLALVEILAVEALARRLELEGLGARLVREADGAPTFFGSCFSPDSRRAVVLADPVGLGRLLRDRVTALGGRIRAGLTALALLRDPVGGRVVGALLEDAAGRLIAQPAGAVVAAMGGTAPLFVRHQAGRGNAGLGHGLLARAGATMANTAFLQWMWLRLDDRRFWPVWELATGMARTDASLPGDVGRLAAGRDGHCPLGHGLPDAALDQWLLARCDTDGAAAIERAGEVFRVALFAQATNGGALIDAQGRTDVPALFAVGECATGMHGANRLGGAMVAACLVFGARAGETAAGEALLPADAVLARALDAARDGWQRDRDEERRVLSWLARTLQEQALPRRNIDGAALQARLTRRPEGTRDVLARAGLVAAGLLGRSLGDGKR